MPRKGVFGFDAGGPNANDPMEGSLTDPNQHWWSVLTQAPTLWKILAGGALGLGAGSALSGAGAAGEGGEGAAAGLGEGAGEAASTALPSTTIGTGMSTLPGLASPGVGAAADVAGAAGSGVGGTIAKYLGKQALGKIGSVVGGAAGQAAQGRRQDDALKLAKANTQLGYDKYADTAPSTRLNSAVRAAVAQGITPTKVQWGGPGSGLRGEIPQYTGGVQAALQSIHDNPDVQSLASLIPKDQLLSQQRGGATGGNLDRTPQGIEDVGNSGGLEKILGSVGLGSSILGSLFNPEKVASGGTGDYNYDPWSDEANYDDQGNYIGEGAYDEAGNSIFDYNSLDDMGDGLEDVII